MRRFLFAVALLAAPTLVSAQGGVGGGPLTSSLVDTEPETGVLKAGPIRLAPGITIREAGYDDNVFDESINEKSDWVIAGTPDLAAFARLRWIQVSLYGGVELQYYSKYSSEQAISPQYRGRVDFLLSRVFPFVAAGETQSRTRPNGEIDIRADQVDNEFTGGLGYTLSAHAVMFGSVITTKTRFKDSVQSGVPLDESLNRDGTTYMGGFKTDITPLLSAELAGSYREDRFVSDPTRDGVSRSLSASFSFSPAAVIAGTASIGFQDYRPDDPLVKPYSGLTGGGFLSYTFLELARTSIGYNRSIEYSFDVTEAYFIQNSINAAMTVRVVGDIDIQGRGAFSLFEYGNRAGAVPRNDTYDEYGGSIGYNLRNKTRIAANYEYGERRSPELAARNYVRRRYFLNWGFAF